MRYTDATDNPRTALIARPAFAWVTLALLLSLTLWLWLYANHEIQSRSEDRFAYRVSQQLQDVEDRMHDYEQVLYGASGLFKSSEFVSRDEWRIYIESLQLSKWLPGIQGVGYAQMIPEDQRLRHEMEMRRAGFPDYAIYPGGEREMCSSIIYLEPFSQRNLRAFGYDMYSDPVRRAAMDRAMDTGSPALSGKVTLVQEMGREIQPGFLMYLPIYRKDMPHNTVESRRAALLGFVYSPFRAGDLMSNIFNDPKRDIDLELFDQAVLPTNLLFDSAPAQHQAKLTVDKELEIAGQKWLLRFRSNPIFEKTMGSPVSPAILGFGALISFLIFAVLYLNSVHSRRSARDRGHLERSSREVRTLAEMTDMLQSCQSCLEAYPIVATTMKQLFPAMSGACYLLNNSGTALESVVEWGDDPPKNRVFAPDACWAMRRGKIHAVCEGHIDNQPCPHLDGDEGSAACVPMMAHGKTEGLLLLKRDGECSDAKHIEHQLELVRTAVDSISLAIANLQLRESLQESSLRDPLTGLYNRRFMEATLERELWRMARSGQHLAIAMLDLDHFKVLNDGFGHVAGDVALKELGALMRSFRQGADVACRYGGEEFILILPEVDPSSVPARMEALRQSIESMSLSLDGQALPGISVSIGIAIFPQHGEDPQQLIKVADRAMYQAKRAGRNRVVVAQ
jgi:diguanylate cyclase (GGDEF)-like protein